MPVSAELFDILIEYADDVIAGEIDFSRRLRQSSPVITFCQGFFVQFFQNELGEEITSIDGHAKQKAVRVRRRLVAAQEARETVLVVTWFEKLVEIYRDVLTITYGESTEGLRDFYENYVLELLMRARSWAESRGLADLVTKIGAAIARFEEAIDEVPID